MKFLYTDGCSQISLINQHTMPPPLMANPFGTLILIAAIFLSYILLGALFFGTVIGKFMYYGTNSKFYECNEITDENIFVCGNRLRD